MYQIARIFLDGVGHRDARFDPLYLDLRGDAHQPALDTLLWLRNAGGKSSLLSLFFSLLQPNRRTFLGRTPRGDKKKLEDYVDEGDVAHVIVEWTRATTDAPGLEPAPGLVTGVVMAVRQAGKVLTLERQFYGFRPSAFGFDDLHTRQHQRRVALQAFVDGLKEAGRRHPGIELVVTDTQQDWTAYLERVGLDPEKFRYQLRMNESEGGADEFLRFASGDEFVDVLVEMVTDPRTVNLVATNLGHVADKLRDRPRHERELALVQGLIERVAPVRHAAAAHAAASAAVEVASGDARLLLERIRAGAARQGAAAEQQAATVRQQQQRQDAASAARSLRAGYLNSVRRRRAELRLAAADQEATAARLAHQQAEELQQAWAAAEDRLHQRDLARTVVALERALADQVDGASDLQTAYARAAARYRARLQAEAQRAREDAAGARRELDGLRATIGEMEQARDAAVAAHSRHQAHSEYLAEQIAAAERALEAAREQGWLDDDASPQQAVSQLEALVEAGEREQVQLQERRDAAHAERQELQRRQRELAPLVREAERALAGLEDELQHGVEQSQALAADPHVQALTEQADPDLRMVAGDLLVRLGHVLERAERQLFGVRVDRLADERAEQALVSTGLLPPTRDAEVALDLLHAGGLEAVSGWQYLAEQLTLDERHALQRHQPLLAAAVVVPPGQLERALGVLQAAEYVPEGPLGVAETGALQPVRRAPAGEAPADAPPGAAWRLVCPAPAHMDPAAAAQALAEVQQRLARAHATEQALADERDVHRRLLERVRAFVDGWPPERWARLEAAVAGQRQRVHDLHAAHADLEVHLAHASDALAGLEERQATLQAELRRWHALLGDLRPLLARVEAVPGWRAELAAHQAQLRKTDVDEQQARTALLELRRQEAYWAEALVASQAHAERWLQAAAAVERIDVEIEPLEADAPLLDLEADYHLQREAFQRRTTHSEHALDLQVARRELGQLEERLRRYAAVLPVTDTLLDGPHGQTLHARQHAQADAEDGLRAAIKRSALADDAVQRARSELERLAAEQQHCVDLPLQMPIGTLEQVEQAHRVLEAEYTRFEREVEQAAALVAEATAQVRAAQTSAGLLLRDVEQLERALDGSATVAEGRTTEPEPVLDADVAHAETQAAIARLARVAAQLRQAQSEFRERAHAVRAFAGQSRFDDLNGPLLSHFREVADGLLALQADERLSDLAARQGALLHLLDELDQHRQAVAAELTGLVRTALQNLKDAQQFRLPAGLGNWSGAPYLRIHFTEYDALDDLRVRLQVLIDELIQGGQRPEGLPLLLKAVHAANRRPHFEVTVLKPNEGLALERASIAEVSNWSGGQRMTTAILIYCLLSRLRAMNRRGRHQEQADVLILDNPIGKANLTTLIDLQRKVAERLGIQLVCTTGVDDKGAVSVFPNVIRLRNVKDLRSGRGFVFVEANLPGDGLPGDVLSGDGANRVSAARVYRRGPGVERDAARRELV